MITSQLAETAKRVSPNILGLILFAVFGAQTLGIGATLFIAIGICAIGDAFFAREALLPVDTEVFVFLGSAILYWSLAGPLLFWPLHLLVPVVAVFGWVRMIRGSWTLECLANRSGKTSGFELVLSLLIVAISGVTLYLWYLIFQPDLSTYISLFPTGSAFELTIGVAVFIGVNALLEEMVWRGLLFRWALEHFGAIGGLFLQAISFGIAHWNGIPNGLEGTVLSGLYGLFLGYLVLRTGKLWLAIAIHALADLVIVGLIFA